MIYLFDNEMRKELGSSKGNQLKWRSGEYWYKADYTGYEGLSEYICSVILEKSTLEKEEYVLYETETIKYKSNILSGCRSKNMLPEGWQLFTVERLIKQRTGMSIGTSLFNIKDYSDRLKFLEEQVIKATGIADFGIYLSKMITIDALFLNEDRHTHNIAVLESPDGKYYLCPFFDHGASLLSDVSMDYPMGEDVFLLMKTVKSKTFCSDFREALEVSEKLFGINLKFHYTYDTLLEALQHDEVYSQTEKHRVLKILLEQKRQYEYLFI